MTNADLISTARAVVNRTIPSRFLRRLVTAVTLTGLDALAITRSCLSSLFSPWFYRGAGRFPSKHIGPAPGRAGAALAIQRGQSVGFAQY